MKPAVLGMAALIAATTALSAAEVEPGKVAFAEDGSVAMSLTGVPGDPAAGRKAIGSKKIGNCVACHQITEMSDVPFHGEIGPSLDGVGERYTEAQIRGIVTDAKHTFADTVMPSFYKVDGFIRPGKRYTGKAADETFGPLLEAQQIEDVVSYLVTLK